MAELQELEREARVAQAEFVAARRRRVAAFVAAIKAGASYRTVAAWVELDHAGVFQIVKREAALPSRETSLPEETDDA